MNHNSDFNPAVMNSLENLFLKGRCPHAILICGSDEAKRAAASRLAAQIIVCSKGSKPCCECENCRKAEEDIHPDIVTFEKPEDKKKFVKDDVKKMVASAYLTPNEAEKKVFIISEMQNMNEECQNLLLKILEEPPVYTTFVLTSQSANVILGTVLSRVVRVNLGSSQGKSYSEKAVQTARDLADAVCSHREYDKIRATASLDGNKKLTVEVLELFTEVLRDSVALKSGGAAVLEEFTREANRLCNENTLKKLLDMYDTVCGIYRSVENNPNYTLLSAVLCSRL